MKNTDTAMFNLPTMKLIALTIVLFFAAMERTNAGLFQPVSSYKSLTGTLTSAVGKAAEKVKDTAKAAPGAVAETAKAAPGAVAETAKAAPGAIAETAKAAPGAIAKTAKDVEKEIADALNTYVDVIKDGVELNCLGFPKGPLTAALESILSSTTSMEDVRFYLATRNKPNYTTIHTNHFTLQNTDFDVRRDTFVLTHGFMAHGNQSWLRNMAMALLKYKDANVFVTDWQKGSNVFNYVSAAASTKVVGEAIAKLISTLNEASPPDLRRGKIHLIGHSLGSHISGRAAYVMKENAKNSTKPWTATRITGLDPAQPCFQTKDTALKLTSDDAPYIDIYHTNARQLLFFGLGLSEQLGFVDFYPNGGKGQPGCSDLDPSFWNFILIPSKLIQESICSHGRSYIYFTESIINAVYKNCSFHGRRWDLKYENVENLMNTNCPKNEVCPEMGYNSIEDLPRNEGVFFVPTGDDSPYCHINEKDREKIIRQIKIDNLQETNLFRYAKELIVGSKG